MLGTLFSGTLGTLPLPLLVSCHRGTQRPASDSQAQHKSAWLRSGAASVLAPCHRPQAVLWCSLLRAPDPSKLYMAHRRTSPIPRAGLRGY